MTDNQLKFGAAAQTVRCEIPSDWPLSLLYGTGGSVSLEVRSTAGTVLFAASAATQGQESSLNGAVSAGSRTLVLAAGTVECASGDRLRIMTSAAGGYEDVEVDYYVHGTRTVTLKRDLYRAHSSGAEVLGLYYTATLNLSSATNFPKGRQTVLGWTPSHGGAEITEVYTIAVDEMKGSDIGRRFRVRFPDLYLAAEDVLDQVEAEALRQIRIDWSARGMDIDRLVDQEIMMPCLMFQMAFIIAAGRGDTFASERDFLKTAYDDEVLKIASLPLWVDDNQDKAKDAAGAEVAGSEVTDHMGLSYCRGI